MNEIITETPSLSGNSISGDNSFSNMISKNSLNIDIDTSFLDSFLDSFNWQQILKYLIIIIILAFLGLNLFTHLGILTEKIKDILSPLTNIIGEKTGNVLKTTTLNTAQGIKGIGNLAGNTLESGVNIIKNELDGNKNNTTQISDPLLVDEKPKPDATDSNIQTAPKTRAGFCYVGEDRGIRSCVKLSKHDKCMSGDIFPTRDLCINPNLRY